MIPRVYVAGPIHGSGRQMSNIRNAVEAAHKLRSAGCVPFVPHLWAMLEFWTGQSDDGPYFQMMDDEWLRLCHAMVRIPGVSPGADHEEELAKKLGIPIFKGMDKEGPLAGVNQFLHEWHQGGIVLKERGELTFSQFENDFAHWIERQPFGKNQQTWEPLLGLAEEVGELSHAHLKQHQGIRGSSEEHERAAKDAIGDILVYAAGYCKNRGWSLRECLETAWKEVSNRDWNRNKQNGQSVSIGDDEDG